MDSTSAAPPKTAKAKKPSAPKKVSSHPPVAEMVAAAIKNLKDRKGSSLPSIKKYIAANNKVDVAQIGHFIRKALKNGVAKGTLVQTKGTGASGSFKLGKAEAKPKKVKTPKKKAAKKPAAKKAAKSTPKKAAKKPAKAKKSPAKAKKSPAKAKKPAAKKTAAKKTPTKKAKKPKAPKVKKSPAKKAATKKPKAKKAAK